MTQQEESANTWSQLLCLILRNYNVDDIIREYESFILILYFFIILYYHLRSTPLVGSELLKEKLR